MPEKRPFGEVRRRLRKVTGALSIGSLRSRGVHQFRRLHVWQAAVSGSSNIAEGAGRGSPKEMARFLRLALGSICELDSQVELSKRLGFVQDTESILSEAGVLKARIKTLEDRVLIPDT